MSRSIRRLSTSIVIVSPSRTAAIGPLCTASGAMWPAMKPRVAPEKRPSVSRATESPRPSPTIAAVTASISRMPGPPAGPSLRMTTTSPSLISPLVTACIAASSPSKTRAGPAVMASLVAGELHDAALGREVAAEDRDAAGLLDRVVDRPDHFLAGRLVGLVGLLADRLAGDRRGVLVQEAELLQALGQDGGAAGGVQVGGDEAPARLEVAEARGGLRDAVEVVDVERRRRTLSATASRCRTPLVEPPEAATARIAFSSDSLVMRSLTAAGLVCRTSITSSPAA